MCYNDTIIIIYLPLQSCFFYNIQTFKNYSFKTLIYITKMYLLTYLENMIHNNIVYYHTVCMSIQNHKGVIHEDIDPYSGGIVLAKSVK